MHEENATTNNGSLQIWEENRTLWYTGETILLIIILFTIYIFLSLLYYTWRRRLAVGVSGNLVEQRERYLLIFCNCAILFALVRCVLHQCILWVIDLKSVDQCHEFVVVSTITYNITICLTYMYLWLRLRNFYNCKDIMSLHNNCLEAIDWIVFVFIIIVSIAMAIMTFVTPVKPNEWRAYHTNTCTAFGYSNQTILLVYAALACGVDLSLIALYVYPVYYLQRLHKSAEKNNNGHDLSTTLYSNIKRSFLMLLICIGSDIAVSTAAARLTKYYPQLFVSILALYDVNLVINVTCIICTFRNWRKILFGFPCFKRFVDTRDSAMKIKKRGSDCDKTSSEFDVTTFSSIYENSIVGDSRRSSSVTVDHNKARTGDHVPV